MATPETPDKPPSLQRQTIALGKTLKTIADGDPTGTPSELSARAFLGWIQEAGPGSHEPDYFADVAANYDIAGNSNQDLWDIFDILENYIEVEDELYADPPRTFIGLPLAPAGGKETP